MMQNQGDYGQEANNEFGREGNNDYGQELDGQQHYYRPQEDPIQEKIQKIIEVCTETGALYGDPEFPDNDASLYIDPANPPGYAADQPPVEWKRPGDIVPVSSGREPVMQLEGATKADITQGTLGDCWLLGAFCVLSTNPELLKNLIYYDGIAHGFAVFQFFKNGRW